MGKKKRGRRKKKKRGGGGGKRKPEAKALDEVDELAPGGKAASGGGKGGVPLAVAAPQDGEEWSNQQGHCAKPLADVAAAPAPLS